MSDTHTARTIHGVNWNFLRVILQTLMTLGSTAVLARLLPPEDFGLLAIGMIFVGFAELIATLGLGPAIIQRRELTHRHLQSAFAISLAMGTGLLLLFFLLAGQIALFFDDPRLEGIIIALSFALWFIALSIVSRSQIMRAIDFKRIFYVDILSYAAGYLVIGIWMALQGFGVWSLVVAMLASQVLSSLSYLVIVPPPLPLLQRQAASEMLHFGTGMSLNGIVNYLALNADNFLIGKFMSAASLGLYNRAFQLVSLPVNKISVTLSTVLFPAYAEIQEDLARLERAYLRAVAVTALMAYPILTGFIIAAEPLIVGLFGNNWRPATPVLQILCIAGMFKAVFHLAGAVIQAKGKVYLELRLQLVYLAILGIGCYLAIQYGLEAIAVVVTLASLWLYLSKAQVATRLLNSSWRRFLRAQSAAIVISAWVALWARAAMYGLGDVNEAVALLIIIPVCGLAFITGFLFMPAAVMGDTPAWVMEKYLHHLPPRSRAWAANHFRIHNNA